jgi:hypothetical protein
MAEDKAISDLNLGFRELFRILLPGAYAVSLAEWLAPNSRLVTFVDRGTIQGLVASFFLGLVGAALVVHETWFPYTVSFEEWRILLNGELGGGSDRVHEYKYFLETRGDDIKDRIHYFSSFYYMLVELSLFSAIAAIWLLHCFFESSKGSGDCWTWLSRALLAVALILQLSFPSSLRERKDGIGKLTVAPAILFGLWLLLNFSRLWFFSSASSSPGFPSTRLFCLVLAAYAFARLGAKHWKSVIKEQIVFVRENIDEIRELPRAGE